MLNVIFEDNHIIVVEKPCNIPTQKDESNDLDMQTIIKDYIKKKYEKPGDVFLGIVHRLDRPVGGIMVFARTSKAASRLSDQIRTKKFQKTYLAVVEGNFENMNSKMVDYLYKDKNLVMSKVVNKNHKDSKEAILEYEVLNEKRNLSLVKIDLKTGRHHQIRVQFASRNHPLFADQKYSNIKRKGQVALWANEITFEHPTKKEKLTFRLDPPNNEPWNLFK